MIGKPIVPNYDNLYQLIEENPQLTKINIDTVKATLNDDFAPKYKAFADAVWESKIDARDQENLQNLAMDMGYSKEDAILLAARHQVAQDISTWEIFTGNGMTQDTNVKDKVAFGPIEVFTYDKRPMELGELEDKQAIKRLGI